MQCIVRQNVKSENLPSSFHHAARNDVYDLDDHNAWRIALSRFHQLVVKTFPSCLANVFPLFVVFQESFSDDVLFIQRNCFFLKTKLPFIVTACSSDHQVLPCPEQSMPSK